MKIRENQRNCVSVGAGAGQGEGVNKRAANINEERFIKVAHLSRLIEKKINSILDLKKEILTAVYAVEDIRLRTLLIARYINFKTWDEIARDMHYSDKWVRTKLHTSALEAARKTIAL